MAPKARTSRNLPRHIQPVIDQLPRGIWFMPSGKVGHWRVEWLEGGKKRSKKLCSENATLAEIHAAFEEFTKQPAEHPLTFRHMSEQFQQNILWRNLSPLTQKDYINCHNAIVNRATKNGGLLGDQLLEHWTKALILNYRDKRAETSPQRANKELSYIKRLFSWAFEYELIKDNISLGISKAKVTPRSHYVEDADYYFMLETAKASEYDYLFYAMELAYLCMLRRQELVDLTMANELPEGLLIHRRKGSRTNIMQWSDRLETIWKDANKRALSIYEQRQQPVPIKKEHRKLLISARTGDPITADGLSTAWERVTELAKLSAVAQGREFKQFWLHDIKKRAITDYKGDKMQASGHKSQNMMNIYDLSVPVVKPSE